MKSVLTLRLAVDNEWTQVNAKMEGIALTPKEELQRINNLRKMVTLIEAYSSALKAQCGIPITEIKEYPPLEKI